LHVAAYAVLRAEKCRQLDSRMIEKDICRVTQVGQDRRLVADQSNILSFEQINAIIQQNFYSRTDSVIYHVSNEKRRAIGPPSRLFY
jgi:hypothetical protein